MGTTPIRTSARTRPSHSAEPPAPTPAPAAPRQVGAFYAAGPALSLGMPLQLKLVVGTPNDPFEREADVVAQRVTSGQPTPEITPVPPGGLSHSQPLQRQPQPDQDKNDATQPLQRQPQPDQDENDATRPFQRQPQPDQDKNDAVQVLQACGCRRACACGSGQAAPEAQAHTSSDAVIQTRATGSTPYGPHNSIIRALQTPGTGEVLRPAVRRPIERGIGVGLGNVRVHRDAAAARALGARAFTHGSNIWLSPGESPENLQLLAHEATHVVQQGAASSAPPMVRPSRTPLIQRALYAELNGAYYLLLWVPFGSDFAAHGLTLDPDVAIYFDANPDLVQQVENELETIFNPPARALHETRAYLEGSAVRQLIVRGLRQLDTTGRTDFSELANLLHQRTELFYAQNLLPDATNQLADALGLDPAVINWNALIPALHTQAEEFEPFSVIDAALRDRYSMFLDMLANEASALPAVVGAATIDAVAADNALFAYVTNLGALLFSAEVFGYHSEKFIDEYLPLIEAVRYVPERFDLEAFRPVADTARIDAARERIIADFIADEAESRVMMYILNQWTASGDDPETFLGELDLEAFRAEISTTLAEELIQQARSDPALMAALRSRATDVARFTQVFWMVSMGRGLETHNASLHETFLNTPLDELSPEDRAIAADPFAYYDTSLRVSSLLIDLLTRLTPNGPIELQSVRAAAAILSAMDMPSGYAALFLLPELLGYLAALQRALEAQERETQRALEQRLDLDFEQIAAIVRTYVEHADAYIRETWIPMLKQIAVEYATANRDDLKYQDENWEAVRSHRMLGFAQGAAELEFMAAELTSGRAEAVEVEGQLIRRDGVAHLHNAAGMLRAAGLDQLDDDAQAEQRDKLRGAIADYDQVIEDINDDTYDPLDYSRAVYDEARRRLGLERMEGVTVGMVLSRSVVATRNPFLEYAVVRWQFKEGLERDFRRAAILFGMGLLTLASALIPGAVGVVLGVIDLGLGIYTGVQGVRDARAILRIARLDLYGTIVGVSEAEAEAALRHAWINLGITLIITTGVVALQTRAFLRRPGGARVQRTGRAVGVTSSEGRLLRETRDLHGSQLRPQQLNAEAQVAARSPSRPSTLRGFEEEINLPNSHTWRRQGSNWCRFSVRPFCMPSSTLPPALRRRAYRDVARTLDEGLDASGRLVTNRGHSFADHGAHTTPAQHQRRLTTGVTPGGSTRAIPPTSSRFATHRAHLDAYDRAINDLGANYLRANGTPKAGYGNTLTLSGAGRSYALGPGGTLIETTVSRFTFYFERNAHGWYDLVTMYPVP